MAEYQTGYAHSDGVKIFYRLFGQHGRTPVLIVHGLSYFSFDWIEPGKALASDRQVAAMDMRGFGESGWTMDYGVAAFARDIIALLDHLGWSKAVLVGHSMGGRNCAYCAAENPGRVTALILVDWSPENAPAGSMRVAETVAGTPDAFASVDDAMRYFKADPHSPQGAHKRARFEAYLTPAPGGFAVKRDPHFRNQFRRALETGERTKLGVDLWAVLAKVACPILVLRGMRSDMFAADTTATVAAANSRIKLAELDTGHDVAGDDPAGFLRETRAFLDRQRD